MLKVYSWVTPNGHQVHRMLEKSALADCAIPVDIGAGAQIGKRQRPRR